MACVEELPDGKRTVKPEYNNVDWDWGVHVQASHPVQHQVYDNLGSSSVACRETHSAFGCILSSSSNQLKRLKHDYYSMSIGHKSTSAKPCLVRLAVEAYASVLTLLTDTVDAL